MAEQRGPYKKAPITEAVIDLRVALPEGTRVEALRDLHSRLSKVYNAPQELYEGVAQIELGGPSPITRAARSLRGYRFDRAVPERVMTAKLDGFSYSALAPYDRWETFRSEAKELWELYRDSYHPAHVTRVAVRYINRINVPLRSADSKGALQLEDYFRTYPQIAEGLAHNTMAGFIMQVQVPQPDLESTLMLNQAVVPPPDPEVVLSVVLDLDLFREVQWDPNDDGLVWSFFDKLRERKNQAFEASITDNTRKLFN
jgi:uncharacterized protein (TIGR04255 family)